MQRMPSPSMGLVRARRAIRNTSERRSAPTSPTCFIPVVIKILPTESAIMRRSTPYQILIRNPRTRSASGIPLSQLLRASQTGSSWGYALGLFSHGGRRPGGGLTLFFFPLPPPAFPPANYSSSPPPLIPHY